MELTAQATALEAAQPSPEDGGVRLFLPKAMQDRPIEKRAYMICSGRCGLVNAVSAIKFDTCDAPNGPALRECSTDEVSCFDKAFSKAVAAHERTQWVNATIGGAGVVLGGILMVGVFFSFRKSKSASQRDAARNSDAPAVLEVQMESPGRSNERSAGVMSK